MELTLKERYLYGSSRLGMNTDTVDMIVTHNPNFQQRHLGKKMYELNNHLGNVLAVVTDKKIPIQDGTTGIKSHYVADVVSVSDYYPGGMLMPGRVFNSGSYRFGHGTQEMVNEISGVGNHYTAEFWEYDSRLVRRWNIDPVYKHYLSNYSVLSGNPIIRVDPLGNSDTDFGVNEKGKITQIGPTNNQPDKLFALNTGGSKKEEVTPLIISDKTILPQLEKDQGKIENVDSEGFVYETGIFRYATSKSKSDILSVFVFASNNSEVEWSAYSTKDGTAAVGTLGFDDLAPSPSRMKIDSKSVLTMLHSHPNPTTEKSEVSSLYGDKLLQPSTQYNYYTYMSKSSNLYKINNGNHTMMKKVDFNTLLNIFK